MTGLATFPSGYMTDEAKALCARVSHKSELSDRDLLMLAMVAAQAALAKHFQPGQRDAEETLNTIGQILDHDDVVEALNREIKKDELHQDKAPAIVAGP